MRSLIYILPFIAFLSSKKLQKCDGNDLLVFAECLPVMNELTTVFEKYQGASKSQETVDKMADVCDKIEACLSPLNCKEAVELKSLMENTCSRLHYVNDDHRACVTRFLEDAVKAQYSNATSCLKDYGFLAENLSKRKKAYTEGKACFLAKIKKLCTKTAQDYFTENYEKFVRHVSTKPATKNCKAPYYEFNSMRCAQMSIEVGTRIVEVSEFRLKPSDPQVAVVVKMCGDIKNCLNDLCAAAENPLLGELTENCKIIVQIDSIRKNHPEL